MMCFESSSGQFQSTLSMRRATTHGFPRSALPRISIHALHEESDKAVEISIREWDEISIHALHEESDHEIEDLYATRRQFQSTLSMRRATQSRQIKVRAVPYFNPRSP